MKLKVFTPDGATSRDQALQAALLEVGAFQCAYCASGMIMSGAALLAKDPAPRDEAIVRFMDGNICRCGTYPRIVAAIQAAGTPGDSLWAECVVLDSTARPVLRTRTTPSLRVTPGSSLPSLRLTFCG